VVFDEGRDDSLTAAEFDDLVTEYNLVSWTAHPALLRRPLGNLGWRDGELREGTL
jgi:hypothetical protein